VHYWIIKARYVRGYIIRVRFNDGLEGDVDLEDQIYGPIFEPLRDIETFKRFRLDPELHTLVWPNGADFSPEFLHEKVRVAA